MLGSVSLATLLCLSAAAVSGLPATRGGSRTGLTPAQLDARVAKGADILGDHTSFKKVGLADW